MSPKFSHLGLVLVLSLTTAGKLLAQAVPVPEAAKPTGPAAKKADDLIRAYRRLCRAWEAACWAGSAPQTTNGSAPWE
jgi:hypothetical protein